MKNSEKGQGLVEFLVAAPLLVALFTSLVFMLGIGWLQLEVAGLTQEYGVCRMEERRPYWCRSRFEQSLAKLPGGFRLRSAQIRNHEIYADFHHRLPVIGASWSFHEPLPKF